MEEVIKFFETNHKVVTFSYLPFLVISGRIIVMIIAINPGLCKFNNIWAKRVKKKQTLHFLFNLATNYRLCIKQKPACNLLLVLEINFILTGLFVDC